MSIIVIDAVNKIAYEAGVIEINETITDNADGTITIGSGTYGVEAGPMEVLVVGPAYIVTEISPGFIQLDKVATTTTTTPT